MPGCAPVSIRLGRLPSGDLLPRLLVRNLFANGGHVLIRRSALEGAPFRTDLAFGEDWECSVRLASAGPFAAEPGAAPWFHVRCQRRSGAYLRMAANPETARRCLDAIFSEPALVARLGRDRCAAARDSARATVPGSSGGRCCVTSAGGRVCRGSPFRSTTSRAPAGRPCSRWLASSHGARPIGLDLSAPTAERCSPNRAQASPGTKAGRARCAGTAWRSTVMAQSETVSCAHCARTRGAFGSFGLGLAAGALAAAGVFRPQRRPRHRRRRRPFVEAPRPGFGIGRDTDQVSAGGDEHLSQLLPHDADDMGRQVEATHFCIHLQPDLHQCVIFDRNEPNARLIGIEYITSADRFRRLPAEEKRLWHSHHYEVKSGQLIAPGIPQLAERAYSEDLVSTYGKTFHTWQYDRDDFPYGVPQLYDGLHGGRPGRSGHGRGTGPAARCFDRGAPGETGKHPCGRRAAGRQLLGERPDRADPARRDGHAPALD